MVNIQALIDDSKCYETVRLMRWPDGFQGGRVLPPMLSNVDLLPTLLEIAGAPVPPDLDGRSFLPLLRGETLDLLVELLDALAQLRLLASAAVDAYVKQPGFGIEQGLDVVFVATIEQRLRDDPDYLDSMRQLLLEWTRRPSMFLSRRSPAKIC